MNKAKQYSAVVSSITRHESLSDGAKLLFAELLLHYTAINNNQDEYTESDIDFKYTSRKSNSYFARTLGKSERAIQRYIKELRDEGVIRYKIHYEGSDNAVRTITIDRRYRTDQANKDLFYIADYNEALENSEDTEWLKDQVTERDIYIDELKNELNKLNNQLNK